MQWKKFCEEKPPLYTKVLIYVETGLYTGKSSICTCCIFINLRDFDKTIKEDTFVFRNSTSTGLGMERSVPPETYWSYGNFPEPVQIIEPELEL